MSIPKALAHYQILGQIGAGGMGEVYRARDTKLDRDVALKILPPDMAADPERTRRFEREAKVVAALNHPNIVTIFSVEEAALPAEAAGVGVEETGLPGGGAIRFLTMELVEGRGLETFIPPAGMPVDDLLKHAIPLADAVASAHEQGITHRDLKPQNVMVDTKGRLKVLDFGLAKVAEAPLAPDGATQAVVTQDKGQVMGTVGYMSPEQAQGKDVDPRSDVFSLGVMLHEMVTGERPFRGDSPMSTISSIIRDEPPPVHELRPQLPPELSRILRRALSKDPERRYQTALGLRNDLQALQEDLQAGTTRSGISQVLPAGVPVSGKSRKFPRYVIPASLVAVALVVLLIVNPFKLEIGSNQVAAASEGSLAVLYFENLVDRDDPERLGEIVTNLIITGLSESEYLSVVSSQRLYDILKRRGEEGRKVIDRQTAGEVAIQAGAGTMLIGSILKTSPTYVITSQLVDTNTGKILKSQRINGEPGEEIFALVDRLSAEVKSDLALPEAAESGGDISVASVTTTSLEAYRLYLQGVEKINKIDGRGARVDLEKAVAIDSTFAMAYYQLAREGLVRNGNMTSAEQSEAAMKAASLVDRVSRRERPYILAQAARLAGDHEKAIAELEALVEELPDETEAYGILAYLYGIHRQDPHGAIRWLNRWVEADPTDKMAYNALVYSYPSVGDFEKAIWAVNQYIQLAPDEANPYDTRGEFYAMMGNLPKGIESFEIAIERDSKFLSSYIGLANIHNEMGNQERAREVTRAGLREAMDEDGRARMRVMFANIPARSGKLEKAIEILNQGMAADEMEGYTGTWHRWKLGLRGVMHHYRKEYDLADADFRQAIESGQKHDDDNAFFPWVWLIISLVGRGELEAAEEKLPGFKAFVEQQDPQSIDLYWVARGWLAMARGDGEGACSNFEQAHNMINHLFPVKYGLGVAYLAVGRIGDAIRELGIVTRGTHWSKRASPIASVVAHYSLGRAYEAAGRPQDAAAQYEIFLTTFKDADPVFDEVGDARERLQRLRPGS